MDAVYCEEGEELLEAYGLAEGEKRKWSIDFYKRLNNNVSEIVKSELKIEEMQKLKREKMVF